mmetsp:Transcript_78032/g.180952  ORF Transcript_78032/g.180952 Transcript_78032/m.180952 type:complete len:300 (+) Transcript_78032:112-1011(+)
MAVFSSLWQVAFPPGGPYDAAGWVPRGTVAARVALFLALFASIWCLILGALKALCPKSQKLHGVERRVWALKGMILFHHATSAVWAVNVILGDPVLRQILTFQGGPDEARRMLVVHPGQATDSRALLVPYTVAYMLSDLLLFPCWAEDPETPLFVIHHLLSIFFWSEGLHYGYGQRYALYLICNELTGSFLVLRWMLSQAGMKASILYAVNGTFFTVLFLLVRVVPIAAIIRSTVLYFPLREPWRIDPPTVYTSCLQVSGSLAIFIPLALNAYWAKKVLKGYWQAARLFFQSVAKDRAD